MARSETGGGSMSNGKPDRNMFSIWSRHDETITLRPPQPGEYVVVPPEFYPGGWEGVFNPLEWDDVVKITGGSSNVTVVCETTLHGGREDCVDINNHCRNVAVICQDGIFPHGLNVLTAKGNSHGIRIEGELRANAQRVEFNLGGWSDQSNEPSSDFELAVSVPGGVRPAQVRKLNARDIHWRLPRIKRALLWLPDWAGPVVMKIWGVFR